MVPDVGPPHGVLDTLVRRICHDVVREPNHPQHVIDEALFSEQRDLPDSLGHLVAVGLLGDGVAEGSCFAVARVV